MTQGNRKQSHDSTAEGLSLGAQNTSLCVKRFILVSKIKRFGENDIRKFNQSNRQCNISVTHKGNESIQTVACTTNSNLLTPLKIKFLANNASCSSTLTTETTNNEPFVNMKIITYNLVVKAKTLMILKFLVII